VQPPLMESLFLLNAGRVEGGFGNAMGRNLTWGGMSNVGVKVQRRERGESQNISFPSRLVASREESSDVSVDLPS
jgi:hypothetical protein